MNKYLQPEVKQYNENINSYLKIFIFQNITVHCGKAAEIELVPCIYHRITECYDWYLNLLLHNHFEKLYGWNLFAVYYAELFKIPSISHFWWEQGLRKNKTQHILWVKANVKTTSPLIPVPVLVLLCLLLSDKKLLSIMKTFLINSILSKFLFLIMLHILKLSSYLPVNWKQSS